MRPIELTLDGFRSFHGSETFRWDGRRLVGIVGPIGSGKSSILDGIAFALYGKTPRIGREVRGLVNQRRDQGTVSLVFAVDDVLWRVVRSLRRSGQPAHVLYRVEGDDLVEVADKRAEVTERVGELLGLDFEGFRRSVLLAQGEFDRFLRGTAAERDDVLKGVFGLDRIDGMREWAKARRDAASADLRTLDALRQSLALDERALADTRESLEPARRRVRALGELTGSLTKLEERHRVVLVERRAAKDRLDVLTRLGERFPDEASTDALLRVTRDTAAERAQAASALADALERFGGREALDRAGELVAVHESQRAAVSEAQRRAREAGESTAEAEQALGAALAEAEAAGHGEAALGETVSKARTALVEAEAALHDARHGAMAATLRTELREGSPCPVCEQPVATLPPKVVVPAVEEAQGVASEARARLREAEAASGEAAARVAAATAAVAAKGEMVTELTERAADAKKALAGATAELTASEEAIVALLGEGRPRDLLETRRAEVAAAGRRLEVAEERSREAARELDELVTSVAALGEALGREVRVAREADLLEAQITDLWETRQAMSDEAEARLREADSLLEVLERQRAALLEGAGLAPDADAGAAATEAAASLAALETRAADLESRLRRLGELEDRQGATVARRDRYERLAADLARTRFPAYVLTERRRILADLGGTLFEALSGSRYRFSDDGVFDIVDLAAAERRRSADSLSGGETFLASLALALALAETVAREGGRLDAFFLDEGFASLDLEHMDLAMEGIERLASIADRLVVVVSHVAGLRDRIEDLITLDKDPLTGDTVVVSGAEAPG